MYIDRTSLKHFTLSLLVAFSLSILSLLSIAKANSESGGENIYLQAIHHPDRPTADFKLDKSRKPEVILPFSQIKPGAKVLEIGAGSGYTTELVSRIIGEKGQVYAETLSPNRIKDNRLTNVTALRRHKLFQLPEVLAEQQVNDGQLDVIIIFFALHDVMMNSRIDQVEFLDNLYKLLKPGGHFVVLDNAAEADSGLRDSRRLHRIGENYVKQKITAIGFKLEAETDALRNPNDLRNQSWRSIRGNQDRFAFRFVKP